jgi:Glyoxalase-like domain
VSNSLFAVTFDCADAAALARFWADVLGWQVAEGSTSEHAVLLADHVQPDARAEDRQNRLHLDVISDTFDAGTERLLSLGAQRLRDVQRDKFRWRPSPISKATSST